MTLISIIMTMKVVSAKIANVADTIVNSMSSNLNSPKIPYIVKVFIINNLYLTLSIMIKSTIDYKVLTWT